MRESKRAMRVREVRESYRLGRRWRLRPYACMEREVVLARLVDYGFLQSYMRSDRGFLVELRYSRGGVPARHTIELVWEFVGVAGRCAFRPDTVRVSTSQGGRVYGEQALARSQGGLRIVRLV